MPLTSPRWIARFALLSLAAVLIASCSGDPQSPTSPTATNALTDVAPVAEEYVVVLADEAPAPAPGRGSWPPGPPPPAAPGVPVPTPPSTHFRLMLKVDPEPVPYSGQPITDTRSCRDLRHTWFYDQILHAETGIPVTFTERENYFDGRFVSKNTQSIRLGGNGTVVLRTRWCSGYPIFHYAQTRFKGRADDGEEITISGPWVRLLAR